MAAEQTFSRATQSTDFTALMQNRTRVMIEGKFGLWFITQIYHGPGTCDLVQDPTGQCYYDAPYASVLVPDPRPPQTGPRIVSATFGPVELHKALHARTRYDVDCAVRFVEVAVEAREGDGWRLPQIRTEGGEINHNYIYTNMVFDGSLQNIPLTECTLCFRHRPTPDAGLATSAGNDAAPLQIGDHRPFDPMRNAMEKQKRAEQSARTKSKLGTEVGLAEFNLQFAPQVQKPWNRAVH